MKGLMEWCFVLCFLLLSFNFQVDCSLSSFSFNSSTPSKSCPYDQSFALIQFKNSLSIDCSLSLSCDKYRRKTISWKVGTNCCFWDGVDCDSETGNVIGLDLSCSCLGGSIPSNSSLFLLHHLHKLNLAENYFRPSRMAFEFGQFTDLTHLNISGSGFLGTIPLEISHLSKLLSLDLSGNPLIFEGHVFEKLLGNLTQLRDLDLSAIDMSLVEPSSFLNISSFIRTLVLDSIGLRGKFPEDVFRLPYLQKFSLFNNDDILEISFPKTNWTGPLKLLRVSYASSLAELPDSIGNLRSLQVLDLSLCQLRGSIPASLGNLTRLNYLDLRRNLITGQLLFSFANFKQLTYLDLSYNNLVGQISDGFGNLTKLYHLSLDHNNLDGLFPFSAFNLTNIEIMSFSTNKLVGPLPYQVSGLSRLRELHLDHNFLYGRIPNWLFTLPTLVDLDLSYNSLTGPIDPFEKVAPLEIVKLQNNEIHGPIPSSVFKLVNLIHLNLSSNKLNGIFELDKLSKLNKLQILSLSNNALLSLTSGSNANYSLPNFGWLELSSCNISEFPDFVRNLEGLVYLDLSYNKIHVIEATMFLRLQSLEFLYLSHNVPLSLSNNSDVSLVLPHLSFLSLSSCNITELSNFLTAQESLLHLDLSNNNIQGQISKQTTTWGKNLNYLDLSNNFLTGLEYYPQNLGILNLGSNLLEGPLLVPPSSTTVFLVSKNKLIGEIPSAICNLTSISILDLSNNNLSGTIPECLCSGETMLGLYILDLHMNKFHGNIPDSFVVGNELQTLNLQNNDFDGPFPKSLVNCHDLEVLNIGNNKINDIFPHWLGSLPQLKVIILRSNYFHGQILLSEAESNFSVLRILDLSHNEFSGFLPTAFFKSFKGMMNLSNVEMKYMENPNGYYHFSMFVTMKGLDIQVERVLTVFTAVDFSSNKFQGKIPEIVGSLTSLQILNFSHNSLTGHIPSSLGNLAALESLDLSSNKLGGEIPMQLTGLKFLGVLNLSQNQLVGHIPQGHQFNTFLNDSYGGNLGLCGFPVSKTCGKEDTQEPPESVFHEEGIFSSALDWKFVMMGYGCGLVLGLSAGYIILTIGKPEWLATMVQRVGYKILRRLNRYH
ncbi:receptor-like protein 12 [Herrania umbratica]|uniref:Receptor-like protein 12 n=1 Tax=Herrania umbratica TaxID=108875 RepID=A0A6J1AP67_9ROSI|nr:receptor-like protein 12 [Herrania umbratica]